MHDLLIRVLDGRQLSKAGQLFSISDYDVIADLHTALAKLKQIFNGDGYDQDTNSQSVVEICLARITSAIRETSSIETYAPGLVDMLESCLNHNLTASTNGIVGKEDDTPHSKIASDLLSSLFLHYGKKSVMTVAIPVAVKALQSGNKDLIRNTSSYLSLAAIHNGRLLAQYSLQIINSITSGNYSLVRVLQQVYPENKEPFHAHLAPLLAILQHSECDPSEKLSILQLAAMVANYKPELIIPHLSEFQSSLMSPNTCTAVLHIFLSLMTMNQTSSLSDQLDALRNASRAKITGNNISTIAKVVAAVGRLNATYASVAVKDLIELCRKSDMATLPILLMEIESVAEAWPIAVRPHLSEIQRLAEGSTSTLSAWVRTRDLCSEDLKIRNRLMQPSSNEEITIIPVLHGGDRRSEESLASRRSSRPSIATIAESCSDRYAPIITSGTTTTFNVNENSAQNSAQELDANTQTLAKTYKMRSSSSLSKQKSRSYGNLTPYNKRSISESGSRVVPAESTTINHRSSPVAITPGCPGRKPIRSSAYVPPTTPIRPPPSYQPPKYPQQPGSVGVYSRSAVILPPTSYQPNVQIGRDGRVRPLPPSNRRNPPPWLPPQKPNGQQPSIYSSIETTFPAAPGGPTTTTTKIGPSSSVVQVIEEEPPTATIVNFDPSPSTTADERSRTSTKEAATQSTDTLENRTNTTSSQATLIPIREPRDDWTTMNDRGDVVRQFCDHRRSKIRRYVIDITSKYPVPVQCTVEGSKGTKHRMRVHFACQARDSHCLYNSDSLFAFKTRLAPTWLHLMFLQMQSNSLETTGKVLAQSSEAFQTLRHCWECMPIAITRNRPFATLVTSAFPGPREQEQLLKELQIARYFDCFAHNAAATKWACFACNHPDRVKTFLRQDSNNPVLEGQLKEKRGRWKFFKRWHTKYFTLSSAALSCREQGPNQPADKSSSPSIDLRKIRSVKSLSRGKKSRKSLPKAFEIFTDDDNSYVLKANDRNKAEEWFQCLQIAVAQAQRERQTTQL